jgi:hypothetical protein
MVKGVEFSIRVAHGPGGHALWDPIIPEGGERLSINIPHCSIKAIIGRALSGCGILRRCEVGARKEKQ